MQIDFVMQYQDHALLTKNMQMESKQEFSSIDVFISELNELQVDSYYKMPRGFFYQTVPRANYRAELAQILCD